MRRAKAKKSQTQCSVEGYLTDVKLGKGEMDEVGEERSEKKGKRVNTR
jgi:hypothetical protein